MPRVDAGIDAGPPCEMREVRLTVTEGHSGDPAMVWNGSDVAVVWNEALPEPVGIYFQRFGVDGVPVTEMVRVSSPEFGAQWASLAWSGSGYGVVWTSTREPDDIDVVFARLDLEGRPVGEEVVVADFPDYDVGPELVWTGTEWAMAWYQQHPGWGIWFQRIDASGTPLGPIRLTDATVEAGTVSIAWNGVEHGLVWSDARDDAYGELYFARLGARGERVAPDVRLTFAPWQQGLTSLAWNGSEYGLTWSDYRDGTRIYFMRIARDMRPGTEEILSPGAGLWPQVASDGDRFFVAWDDQRTDGLDVYARTVGGPEVRLGSSAASEFGAEIVATPDHVLVAWSDTRDDPERGELYWAELCPRGREGR